MYFYGEYTHLPYFMLQYYLLPYHRGRSSDPSMVWQKGKGGFPLFSIMNESLFFDFSPEAIIVKHYQ